jgi:hypothetical protein
MNGVCLGLGRVMKQVRIKIRIRIRVRESNEAG